MRDRRRAKERRGRPKERFNNFYFSLGADDSTLPDVVKRIGSRKLMIGSNYPHPDGLPQHGDDRNLKLSY
jgi:hypothetical protein